MPLACVMGEVDLVRALALAGIRSAVFAQPGNPALYARSVVERIPWSDPRAEPGAVVGRLLEFARRQPEPPVLYFDGDWDLLLVSRHRDALAEGFRFVLPAAELVEDLTDKARFTRLAERIGLPVPPARHLRSGEPPEDLGLGFPVVVKPITRDHATWLPVAGGGGKAIFARDADAVRRIAAQLAQRGEDVLVQQVVEGPESRIESYHVYVDGEDRIAGEFTGRKLRTYPVTFGYSTAVTVTAIEDLRAAGRDATERLGLRGVAKLDFKRDAAGDLHLLEVNARFNLWHHPGAIAGVNLPALVFADLTGAPRPAANLRRDASWCTLRHDARAAREQGIGLREWLGWAARCEAKLGFAWNDPLPLPRALAWRAAGRLRRGG